MPLERNFNITDKRGGAAISVRVFGQAERAEIAGILNTDGPPVIRVRVTAASEGEPAANAELVALLAEKLGVDSDKIAVVAGETKRDKIISIEGLSNFQVDERLFGERSND